MVQNGKNWVSRPLELKYLLVLWNTLLALFSIIGTSQVLPFLYHKVMEDGLQASMCDDFSYYMQGRPGFFLALFIYSKFLELIDTLFLILRQKEVIFLHWFHHVTVLLFCWLSYHTRASCGMWFGAVNYFVHSLMYTYYALAISGVKSVFFFAPFITSIQLFQMVMGISVLLFVASAKAMGTECRTEDANWKLGLAMYSSYFVLFAVLFYDKYMVPKSSQPGEEKKEI